MGMLDCVKVWGRKEWERVKRIAILLNNHHHDTWNLVSVFLFNCCNISGTFCSYFTEQPYDMRKIILQWIFNKKRLLAVTGRVYLCAKVTAKSSMFLSFSFWEKSSLQNPRGESPLPRSPVHGCSSSWPPIAQTQRLLSSLFGEWRRD